MTFFPHYTYSGHTHRTLIILNFLENSDILYGRFTGFAREPGLMQLLYLLAFINSLNRNGGVMKSTSLLIIFGLFLGESTTGLIILVLIIIMKIKFNLYQITFIVLAGLLLYPYILEIFTYQYQFKLIGSESFNYRYDTYDYLISADLGTILFGVGNFSYITEIFVQGKGGWDTFLQFSQRFGLLNFLLISLIWLVSNRRNKDVFFVLFLTSFAQIIWFYPVVTYLFFKESVNRRQLLHC